MVAYLVVAGLMTSPSWSFANVISVNSKSAVNLMIRLKSDGKKWVALQDISPLQRAHPVDLNIDQSRSSVLWMQSMSGEKYAVSFPNRDLAGDVRLDVGEPHMLTDYQHDWQGTILPVAIVSEGREVASLDAVRLSDDANDAWAGECTATSGQSATSGNRLFCNFGDLSFIGQGFGNDIPIVGGTFATDGSSPQEYIKGGKYSYAGGGFIFYEIDFASGSRHAWFHAGGPAAGAVSGYGDFGT
jgi:hypothetical protein